MSFDVVLPTWLNSLFIDNEFVAPSGDRVIEVFEKTSGDVLGVAGIAELSDLDTALVSAKAAQQPWWDAPYDERSGVLRAMAEGLRARRHSIVELIALETGSILGKAEYEVSSAIDELYAAAALASRPRGELLSSHDPNRLSISERIPVGVVAAITPWNFPLNLAMRVLAPALALGNAVVLKPSPETPFSGGLLLGEIAREAGAPAGIVQVLVGEQDVSEALVRHPLVDMVHFTGSTAVGSQIAGVAGAQLKRVSLELGGNNSLVVLDDADLENAAMIGAWSSFHYSGQTCITAGRHLVHSSLVDEYVDKLSARARAISLGDPLRDGSGLGPLINSRQARRAFALLEESVAQGARVVEGGTFEGTYFRPTVLADVSVDMPIWTDEIFAPIAPVLSFETDQEALDLVNATSYGLVNSVLTRDEARGHRFARRVRSGMVHINDATPLDEVTAPFGGIGASGLGGRAGGEANIDEFTERRWITAQHGTVSYPY